MSEEEQGAAPTQGRFRVVHQSGITLEVVVDRTVPAAELLERVIQEMGLPRGDALGRPYPAYLVHEGRTLEGTETLEQVPDDAELEVRLETVVFAGGGVEEPERAARGRTGSPRGAKPPRAAPSAIPAWAKRRADNE